MRVRGVVVLPVVASAIVLAACGGSSAKITFQPGTTTGSGSTGTTVAPTSTSAASGTASTATTAGTGSSLSATDQVVYDTFAKAFKSSIGSAVSDSAANCMAQGIFNALGAARIISIGLAAAGTADSSGATTTSANAGNDGFTKDEQLKVADVMFRCGFLKEALATSAKDAGVTISDAMLTCISDKASKDDTIRSALGEVLGDNSSTSGAAETEAIRKIALDCGVPQSDLDKLGS